MAAPVPYAVGAQVSGTGAVNVPYPATVNANDIAWLFCETANETVTAPAGFTQVASSPQATGGSAGGTSTTQSTVFWRRCTGSEGGTTVALADPGDHILAQIALVSGAITSGDPVNASTGDNTGTTSSTSVTIPSITTTVADCLVMMVCNRMGDLAGTDRFSGWTNANLTSLAEVTEAGTADGNGGGFAVAAGVKATAGATGTTTATLADSSRQARIIFAIKPDTGGAGPISGTASPTFSALTTTSAAAVQIKATSGKTLGALTSTSASVVALLGAANNTLGALTTTAVGGVALKAAANDTLGALTSTSAATLSIQGSGSVTLAALTTTAAGAIGSVPISATASITLGALTSTSAAILPLKGVSSISLAALTSTSATAIAIVGAGAATFSPVVGSGQGFLALQAAASPTLQPLTVLGVGGAFDWDNVILRASVPVDIRNLNDVAVPARNFTVAVPARAVRA